MSADEFLKCPLCNVDIVGIKINLGHHEIEGCPDGYDVLGGTYFPILIPKTNRIETIYAWQEDDLPQTMQLPLRGRRQER